jgi:1-acyl-sn-glycerol-3-phosphate acyltransferase
MANSTEVPIHHRTKKRTEFGPITRWIGATLLRLIGWRVVGEHPHVNKCVVACAPHTSNWDFPLTFAAAMALGIPGVFMMKDTMFWWPLSVLLRWMGCIPINRRSPVGIVDQMVQVVRESGKIYVVITPEGTRNNAAFWKLGFYRIANGAGVPILFGIMNYKEKWIGVADLFYITGDLESDWREITDKFEEYVGVTPRYRPQELEYLRLVARERPGTATTE